MCDRARFGGVFSTLDNAAFSPGSSPRLAIPGLSLRPTHPRQILTRNTVNPIREA